MRMPPTECQDFIKSEYARWSGTIAELDLTAK